MSNPPEGFSTVSQHTHQTSPPPHRPLGVTLIVLYLVLATLVSLIPFLTQPLGLATSAFLGEAPSIVVAAISVPLTLMLAWGLWRCRSWARTLIVGVGIPIIGLSFLGGTAGFKTWMLLAIVLYLFQPRVGEIFYTAP